MADLTSDDTPVSIVNPATPSQVLEIDAQGRAAAAIATLVGKVDGIAELGGLFSLAVSLQSKKLPIMYGAGFSGVAAFAINAGVSADLAWIRGSATKTIKVYKVVCSGSGSTAQQATLSIIKRSTANTGGTAVTVTAAPFDSLHAAATAVVQRYTADPTEGTAVGTIAAQRKLFPLAGSGSVARESVEFDLSGDIAPVVLRGVNESLALNLSAGSGNFTPTISGYIMFSEE